MKRFLFIVIALIMFIGVIVKPSDSASFTYTQRRKEIKVGVITLSGAPCANARPYIFFVLDQRTDLKPPGWEFVNPAAPARANRTVIDCHPGLGANTPIFKNSSAYWEVPLSSTSMATLTKYDLLYLSLPQSNWASPPLDAVDAEKLRKFVDAGGQLWLDGSPQSTNWPSGTPFFTPFPSFSTASGGYAQIVSRHHPIVSYPYWLSDFDVNYLGPQGVSGRSIDANPNWYQPIILNSANGKPAVAVCEYGSGHVIVTSGDVGFGIAGSIADDTLSLDIGNRIVSNANPVCLKFAYNVIAWSAVYSTSHRDARHSGRSRDQVSAPMVNKFTFIGASFGMTTPAFLKGVFFVSDNNGTVRAFDADPKSDLDMDSSPDDGYVDPPDAPYDLIWQFQIPGASAISSPTVATVPIGGGQIAEVVFVAVGQGGVVALEAFPRDPISGKLLPTTKEVPYWKPSLERPTMSFATPPMASPPPAPTYYQGWVYAACKGASGGLMVAQAVSPPEARFPLYPNTAPSGDEYLERWEFPSGGLAGALSLGDIVGSPSIGWVKDETSEALDLMVYLSCRASSLGTVQISGRVFGLVLAVRNERLKPVPGRVSPTGWVIYEGRSGMPDAVGQKNPLLWQQNVTYTARAQDQNGNPIAVNITPVASSAGRYNVQASTPNQRAAAIYLDYLIEPTTNRQITAFDAPSVTVNNQPIEAHINSTPAIAENDIVYYGVVRGGQSGGLGDYRGGQLYAFREGGPTRDQVKWNYYIAPGAIRDFLTNPAGVPLPQLQFKGTPVIGDNIVYAAVAGEGSAGGSGAGAILAFEANPEFCFYLDNDLDTNKPITIKQIDWLMDPTGSLPPLPISLRGANFDTFTEGKITIKNFYGINLTPSSDVVISYWSTDGILHEETHYAFPYRMNEQGFIPALQPRPAVNDKWNNLLWYFIPHHRDPATGNVTPCRGISGSPTLIGDYLYFICDDGHLMAIEAKPHLNDPDIPKNGQVFGDIKPANSPAKSHVKWDEDLKIVGPTSSGGAEAAQWAIASAGGYIGVVTSNAFMVYHNPTTIIADSNRILEVDGSASVLWMCEGTIERGAAGGAPIPGGTGMLTTRRKSFNRPTAVKKIGTGEYICADTGNNRVVRFDRGGTTILEITTFLDPLGKLDPGDPSALRGPTDVVTWTNRERDPVTNQMAVVQHYLIADKGNHRVLDLALRLNAATGEPLQPVGFVVLWSSRTHNLGKKYAYQTAQIAPNPADPNEFFVLAAISNYAVGGVVVGSVSPERIGSSIVLLKYRKLTDSNNLVWQYGDGLLLPEVISETNLGPISGLTYFARYYEADKFTDVICDIAGVHVRRTDGSWWHLLSQDYQAIPRKIEGWDTPLPLGIPLRATSAKLVDKTRLLITNSYLGTDAPPPIVPGVRDVHGEVVEVDMSPTAPEGTILMSVPRPQAILSPGTPPALLGIDYILEGTSILAEPGFAER